jgi:signal transduction histidine kinase/CheY-like chemotaxis protein
VLKAQEPRVVLQAAMLCTVGAAVYLLHPYVGPDAAALGLLNAVLGASLFGLRGGLVVACLQLLTNTVVLTWLVHPPATFTLSSLVGTVVSFILAAAVGSQRDTSLRLRAQWEQNRSLRNREQETLAAIPDNMVRVEPDGTCHVRGAQERRSLRDALAALDVGLEPRQAGLLEEYVEQVRRTGEPWAGQLQSQSHRHYEARCLPAADRAVLVVLRDVTDQRALQQQLASTENLASIGTLAAGLAHEINNPLTYVVTSVSAIGEANADRDAAVTAEVEAALEGCWRIRDLVHSILETTTADDEVVEPVSLPEVIDSALSLVQHQIRNRATVSCEFDTVPFALGHRAKLVQVLVNLLSNAVQAFEEGQAEANEVVVGAHGDGESVVVSVRDNGPGMTEATRRRAIEPFFTTKEPGEGTGLGLFLCSSIVKSQNGTLTIESKPGSGTTITVRLPVADAVPDSRIVRGASVDDAVASFKVPRSRVLVVDDEPEIRRALRRLLGRSHTVSGCASGVEALELIRDGERFDVILCDLLMPAMTGMELLETLAAEFPDQASRMVFVTGAATSESAQGFVKEQAHRVIRKPFTPKAIEAALLSVRRPSASGG